MDLCRTLGWLPDGRFRASPRAKPAALTAWHSPAYVAALQAAEATGTVDAATQARHNIGTLSNPVFPQIYSRPATGAGGVMLAAVLAMYPSYPAWLVWISLFIVIYYVWISQVTSHPPKGRHRVF